MPLTRPSALAFALLTAFAAPHVTRAQSPATPIVPDDVRSFAADYVAAVNAKDSAKLWSFLTPETRSCVNPANKDVYDALFNVQFDDTIPSNYTLALSPVSEANIKAFAESQFFTTPPEQQLQIDYQIGDDAGSLILWLVHQNGRLYADQPCATVEFIINYRVQAAARAHIKALAAEIQDPLRAELLALLADHKRSAAITRYKSATSCDMRTAMLVISTLKHTANVAATAAATPTAAPTNATPSK
jgi:hypothetical protein